jgi:hypothetical protein
MKNQSVGDLMLTLVKRYNLAGDYCKEVKTVVPKVKEESKPAAVEHQPSSLLLQKLESLEREN